MRILPPTLAGFVVLLAVSAQAVPTPTKTRAGARSPSLHSPSVWATTDAVKVSTKPSGVIGGASGGGVRALQIDDLAALGRRLNGPGPRDCSDLPCCPRLRGGWLGRGLRNGIPARRE